MKEVKGTLQRKELNKLKRNKSTFRYITNSKRTSYFVKGNRLKLSELKQGQARYFRVDLRKWRIARKISVSATERRNKIKIEELREEKFVDKKKPRFSEFTFVSGFDYSKTKNGYKVKPNKQLSLNVEITLIRKSSFDNFSAGRNIDIFIQEFLDNNGFNSRSLGYDGGTLRDFGNGKIYFKESTFVRVDFRRRNKSTKWANILENELDNFCRGL